MCASFDVREAIGSSSPWVGGGANQAELSLIPATCAVLLVVYVVFYLFFSVAYIFHYIMIWTVFISI